MAYVSFIWHTIVTTFSVVKVFFMVVLGFAVLEFIIPAERRQPFRNHFSNLQYVLIYYFVTPFALILPAALLTAISRKLGPGLLNLDLEHVRLGITSIHWTVRNVLLPFVPLVVYDFFYYWHHRLQHTVPSFWAIHRLHHSIESLNALAANRVHWLEEPMRVFTMSLPTVLLFNITEVQGAWIAFALAQIGVFIHSNLRISLGPLTPVFVGPQLHRLHHSYAPEHRDHNYSAIFPVWDILFGTYRKPKPGEWPVTGLADGQHAGTVAQEIVQPFVTWGKAIGGWFTMAGNKRIRTIP
jgi:sterol desaturase/sphingolipid hydroxylase (fatty acid hydroxylase superfamily)